MEDYIIYNDQTVYMRNAQKNIAVRLGTVITAVQFRSLHAGGSSLICKTIFA